MIENLLCLGFISPFMYGFAMCYKIRFDCKVSLKIMSHAGKQMLINLKPCRVTFSAGFPLFATLQDEPRGKNIAKRFLFTAKIITKYIVFFGTFSLYLRTENVKICKLLSNLMLL